MALNPLRVRRSIVDTGGTSEQADDFTEALPERLCDLLTKDDLLNGLDAFEQRIIRKLLVAMIGMAAVIIGATALLTQL